MLSKTAVVFLGLLAFAAALEADNTDVGEARDGTITLSGGSSNIWYNLIYVLPILAAIILLDFAIFGTFATRADKLNPVSQFFYHARQGLANIRNRNTRRYFRQQPPHRPQYPAGQFQSRSSQETGAPDHKLVTR